MSVKIITGNSAAALGAKICKVQVISAYPITPQTSVTETLSQYVEAGDLKAEYVRVESEHSALTVCISASTVGARSFTSTSSHGLLYMHEQVHWAAGSRLPIVMCCVNRGVGAPWTIFNDQQDSLSQRDTGWIQLYCKDNQEIIDTVIQAYKIAETSYLPVMVCYDGFLLSHTMMPVDIPKEKDVDKFLPPYKPYLSFSKKEPINVNPVVFPWKREDSKGVVRDGYMELRQKLNEALISSKDTILNVNNEFNKLFKRESAGLIWEYNTKDADVCIIGIGSIASEAEEAADLLRKEKIKVGVLGIRCFRPFPKEEIISALKNKKYIVVFEKAVSYGFEGIVASEVKAALYDGGIKTPLFSYIAGLGGRDVKPSDIASEVKKALLEMKKKNFKNQTKWFGC